MPDTPSLINNIIDQLTIELARAVGAANEAHNAATHEESVAETQYDTLGLEASYLAAGQSRRVLELQQAITLYHQLTPTAYTDDSEIGLGAVIILNNSSGMQRHLFMGPASGGLQVSHNSSLITVITPASPLGESLLRKAVGDEVYVGQQQYEITHIQ